MGTWCTGCSKKGFVQAAGVDISEEQIKAGLSLNVKNLYRADLSPFLADKEQFYDLIIARDVFEHFTKEDFLDTLFLIRKALCNNGKLIIQVPNGEGIHMGFILYADATHEAAYTVSSLRQLAFCAGFKNVNVYPVNPKSQGIKGIVRSLLWKWKV